MDQFLNYLQIFIQNFFLIYSYIIIFRIILTWFPHQENFVSSFLSDVSDPYLDLFKKIIPPIGMLDLSPIVAIFALRFIARFIILFLEYSKQFI